MFSTVELDTHSLKNLVTEVQASKATSKELNELKNKFMKAVDQKTD